MGLNFEFVTATQIVFGTGTVKKVRQMLEGMGRNILLVTGEKRERAKPLAESLLSGEFEVNYFSVGTEPSAGIISEGVKMARETGCDVVVGLGGGSVIDSAKAIAALVPNKGELLDYLEVIGKGQKLLEKPLPFIAIPTTAGTGAEVTKNAVIHSPEHRVKVSLRSPLMFPDVAVVDPELTVSMPPEITATTGMDALTHLLETFVSNQANPFIDTFCREGMHRVAASLKKAFENGTDLKAREDMSFASMLGGMSLANVKLGAVHGFAGPMGGMFPVPHGAVCATLLPAVMEVNLRAVTQQNQQQTLAKYNEVAQILTGNPEAGATDGIQWAREMVQFLNIPALSAFGLSAADFPVLVEKAKKASSMKGNPVELNDKYLLEILEKSV
ncbi:iron-containing alcohol dehydrogenase [Mariniphaga sediminis]|uniref:Iron-containing alcohol dehydrogenase n=1 Tax=Mariniphaga sediminis TaxID=1628158 RepID=A0A399D656_9BACT|nr:iron-containing alcohol dehydrogenase [Mariniphaga sediminis]RIH65910.1 iron-containing alcohol dehydrogenase [Mariniphaga sediminis]